MGAKKIYTDEELRERRRVQARGRPRHYTPEQREENRIKAREYRANRTAAQTGGPHDLLGGAERTSTKPRGFIDAWRPQPKTETLLEQVEAILEKYREHLPLTIRQIFYRLRVRLRKNRSRLCAALRDPQSRSPRPRHRHGRDPR
jgi:hypothetical protein